MKLLQAVARIGLRSGDDPRLRQHKRILTLTAALKACACPAWGIAYAASGDVRSAAIPLGYTACTVLSLVHFARTKGFAGFRFRQALLIFALPFLMHASRGGFVSSSGVVLWALLAPLTFLLFHGSRASIPWFAAYALLVIVAGAVDPLLSASAPETPEALIACFFAMNILTVSAIAYAAVQYFARQLAEEQEKLAELVASSAQALDDVARWSSAAATQIAEAIGALEVAVWKAEAERMVSLTATTTEAPSAEALRSAALAKRPLSRSADVVIPVIGMSGDVHGALVIVGSSVAWTDTTRRLVDSFAHHLGSALELSRMRKELAGAAERRKATLEDMVSRGIDVLQICPSCHRCYDQSAPLCSYDGAALSMPRPFPYRIAGRYRLTRVVAEGGMGRVFRAQDERLGRDVAIKAIRTELFNNDDVRVRFAREARLVARIQHPSVIEVYDSGELEDGSLYIVMEWLEGCNLAHAMRDNGPGTPPQVALLLREGASALAAAHAAGLVHRDVKPENIYLVPSTSPGGFRVKILDFGIAKEISADVSATSTGIFLGTPLYMAPEQASGRPVDARSDIYSFAAVAYQALTGRRVTVGDDISTVLSSLSRVAPPPVSSLLPGTPPAIDDAFARALALSPDERPDDIEAWVSSFVDHLDALPRRCRGWRAAGVTHDLDDFSRVDTVRINEPGAKLQSVAPRAS
ncbi:serine/threonine-protein kinase [Sorangium cellulosum]|uniref:Protein kinase n=1 Tax=Sorangium cellulosum TaxID=56 RepID=A0A150QZ18_SORCE|nr:serine/threonine-protein kinase [Sorangium cellulosum]KYF73237.1 protein kinase [Sorangium cellulosum]